MERKYQLLMTVMLLGLLMITVYIFILASFNPTIFKVYFNNITISHSQFLVPLSKNITTKEPLTLPEKLKKSTLLFLPSKYSLIVKLEPEAGLANRLFMYASALGIALENNRTLEVYPPIPEMQTKLSISSSWISNFKEDQYTELKYEK